jgi:hypothetical protein
MYYGSSQLFLNGVPSKPFKCKRSVRQGDPLSPLLFVMTIDLLQSIINKVYHMNILKHPLSKDYGQDYSIVQYADDTLLILPADARQLLTVKGFLRSFTDSTELRVNFSKSFLVPSNMDDDRATHLPNTIGCSVGTLLFTYLGIPLATTRLTVEEFSPFLNRIKKRMMGLNKLLRYTGRLLLVNSIFSALLTFYMLTLKMPIKILDQVDKYMKHCFWNKGDVNRKGRCLVVWKKATKPKN